MTDPRAFDPARDPHRRLNPLTGEWVLVSPQRAQRPWQGDVTMRALAPAVAYQPDCYLCPGNVRANGVGNPAYQGPFVFANDFPALLPDSPAPLAGDHLLQSAPAQGEARVICFSPRHDRTLPELSEAEVLQVVETWQAQAIELGRHYRCVEIFENKGAMMGCSNPHPHGQIWASAHVPSQIARENACQCDWLDAHGVALLAQLVAKELAEGVRIVDVNPNWLALVPYWAAWPFETLLIAREPVARMADLTTPAKRDLALILRRLTARYDNLFGVSFPYSMGWHEAPGDTAQPAAWRLHAHFYPPLLRSATIRKFMVGYELLAEAQRDVTPEQAAARLRAAAPVLG